MHKDKNSKKGSAQRPSDDDRARLYDDLFAGDLFGLFTTNLAGRVVNCNVALAQLLGYGTREELLQVSVADLYFDLDERQRFIDQLIAKRRLNNYEVLLKHSSGRPVHVLENVVLREDHGKPAMIEGVVIDITALRESEQQQRVLANNYRQLTEHIKDGLLVVCNGTLVYANPAAEALMGENALVGKDLLLLVAPNDRPAMARLIAEAGEGREVEADRIRFGNGQGRARPLLVQATGTWHMNGPALQFTLQDVEAERDLMKERLRATMAEEMNLALRAEIQEHEQTQAALVKSRRLAQSLIDSSLDMIVAVDPPGHITEFNPAASIKFGYEASEVLGKHSRLLYADEREFDRVQQELNRYGAYAGEVRNITREGKEFTSFLAASRLFDEESNLLGSMGVSRDVTQAKRDREALHQSEERYRDLVDNANDLIQTVGPDGRFIFVNKAWQATFGYTPEDLGKLTFYDLMGDGEKKDNARLWMDGQRGAAISELWQATFLAKDGRRLLCEGTSSVRQENGKVVMARSIFRDITASYQAQEQLRKHAAKEKALFQASEHLFWTVDRRLALTSFNQGYHDMIVRMHGNAPRINTLPDTPRELFAPKDYHDFWAAKYEQAFKGQTIRFETDRTDMAGQRVCNEIYLSPLMDADGQVVEVFGIGHEVTAERVAEERVREQGAKLSAIFESNANVMIWSIDQHRKVTSANKHFIQVVKENFGVDVELGLNLRDNLFCFITPDGYETYQKVALSVLEGSHGYHETALIRADGSIMWIEFFASPISTDGVTREISFLAHDITEKKLAEKAMADSLHEKEVLLKEVHHRVKNNLQIISSIFSLQRDHVAGDQRLLTLLQESKDRIRSMSFIHESLYQNKNFSHVDMVRYIEGLCGNLTMSYALGGRIKLATELQPLLLDIDKAIPCGLVLNELISNALKHAFPDGREGEIAITMREDGKTVMIQLADNGVGFPPGFRDQGDQGLGLELVHLLMEQLDGKARRSNREGSAGTAYLITFERS